MIDEILDLAECPKCTFGFAKGFFYKEKPGFGIVECRCSTYPVVEGILVLKDNALTHTVKHMLRRGRVESCVSVLIQETGNPLPFGSVLKRILSNVVSPYPLLTRYLELNSLLDKKLASEKTSFVSHLESMELGYLEQYLKYRTFEDSFWNLNAMLPVIEEKRGPILDYGGGWGHSSYLLKECLDETVFNLDVGFLPLYFHRKYIDDEANCVLVGKGSDIPFPSGVFGTVLDLDGFHYVSSKYSKASEYQRVVGDEGQIMLLHTHNRLCTSKGHGLTSEEYSECFDWGSVVFPEESFLDRFLSDDTVLQVEHSTSVTDQDVNVLLRKDLDEPGWFSLDKDRNPLTRNGLSYIVNPVYEIEDLKSGVKLERSGCSTEFRSEFRFSFERTNEKYFVDDISNPPGELLYKGVVSVLPETYSGE